MSTKTYNKETVRKYCLFESNKYNPEDGGWSKEKLPELRMCKNSDCKHQHMLAQSRPKIVCPRGKNCDEADITCRYLHPTKDMIKVCNRGEYGINCGDSGCKKRHCAERRNVICTKGKDCTEAGFTCHDLHPLREMIKACRFISKCMNFDCNFRHPASRVVCKNPVDCWEYLTKGVEGCNKIHSKIKQGICRNGDDCKIYMCYFAHSPNAKKDCEEGEQCPSLSFESDNKCDKKHPVPIRQGIKDGQAVAVFESDIELNDVPEFGTVKVDFTSDSED